MARTFLPLTLILASGLAFSGTAVAQTSAPAAAPSSQAADQESKIRDLEDRIIALENMVRELKAAQGQPAAAAAPPAAVPAQPAAAAQAAPAEVEQPPQVSTGGATSMAKALNPDISVIGDFLGAAGHNSIRGTPSLQMHESEVGFQAVIDPYARGDFFISFGEEGVDLEEGYITFTALPAGLVAKVGKMRSAFGKVNTLHNHVLPWTDRPLMTENLVGGEDGINDAGISVTRIFQGPKGLFFDGTAQVFRGDSADVFKANSRRDLSVVGHFRGYKDITESTNLDIGASYARGHNDLETSSSGPMFLTNLYGLDATLRWKPLRRSIYHSFIARSEFVWSKRDGWNALARAANPLLDASQRTFGYYASADYQLARRWFAGIRYDHSGRARNASQKDQGGSFVLTYWPSEFAQLRGQYRATNFAEGITANELLFQVQFSLGAHGAHPF